MQKFGTTNTPLLRRYSTVRGRKPVAQYSMYNTVYSTYYTARTTPYEYHALNAFVGEKSDAKP
jgi:hypothetical protein